MKKVEMEDSTATRRGLMSLLVEPSGGAGSQYVASSIQQRRRRPRALQTRERACPMILLLTALFIMPRLVASFPVNLRPAFTKRSSMQLNEEDFHGSIRLSASSSAPAIDCSPPVELSYTSFGDGTGDRSIIFLHGLLGNKRNFATIATALSQICEGDNIYSLDLRNHGSTAQWHGDMSYTAMARDVICFCQSLNLQKVTLVGHSMGGKVAQAVALLYPEQVEGLVVLDMAPVEYCPNIDAHWKAVCDIIDLLHEVSQSKFTSKRDLDMALRPGIPDPALRAFCLTNWNDKTGEWKVNIPVISQQLEVLAGFDLNTSTDDLTYTGDVLLVHGGQSRFVRHSYLPTIQSYFPNHMLTTIRGAGHWLHAEKPQDCISILQQYLQR